MPRRFLRLPNRVSGGRKKPHRPGDMEQRAALRFTFHWAAGDRAESSIFDNFDNLLSLGCR